MSKLSANVKIFIEEKKADGIEDIFT